MDIPEFPTDIQLNKQDSDNRPLGGKKFDIPEYPPDENLTKPTKTSKKKPLKPPENM